MDTFCSVETCYRGTCATDADTGKDYCLCDDGYTYDTWDVTHSSCHVPIFKRDILSYVVFALSLLHLIAHTIRLTHLYFIRKRRRWTRPIILFCINFGLSLVMTVTAGVWSFGHLYSSSNSAAPRVLQSLVYCLFLLSVYFYFLIYFALLQAKGSALSSVGKALQYVFMLSGCVGFVVASITPLYVPSRSLYHFKLLFGSMWVLQVVFMATTFNILMYLFLELMGESQRRFTSSAPNQQQSRAVQLLVERSQLVRALVTCVVIVGMGISASILVPYISNYFYIIEPGIFMLFLTIIVVPMLKFERAVSQKAAPRTKTSTSNNAAPTSVFVSRPHSEFAMSEFEPEEFEMVFKELNLDVPYTEPNDLFLRVLQHPILSRSFQDFCVQSLSAENFFAFRHIVKYRRAETTEEYARQILNEFITPSSVFEVDLPGNVKSEIMAKIESQNFTPELFVEMEKFVYMTMRHDSFPAWRRSEQCKTALRQARLRKLQQLINVAGRRESAISSDSGSVTNTTGFSAQKDEALEKAMKAEKDRRMGINDTLKKSDLLMLKEYSDS